MPDAIGNFPQLTVLYIAHNQNLTGTLPNTLSNLYEIKILNILRNNLNGTIPDTLVTLSKLSMLIFAENALTGTIPEYLCSMTNLSAIDFSINQLNGSIPNCIGNIANLTIGLALSSNYLTGTIPSSLGNLSNALNIDLHWNQLTGTIPPSVGYLVNLKYLALFGNKLSGSLPASIGNMAGLHGLYIYTNRLTGPIPATLGSLSLLHSLDTNTNLMTGTIPEYLTLLPSLVEISLFTNFLTGSVPSEISRLTKLEYLQVHDNYLTGTIPTDIGILGQLRTLQVSNNWLTGTLPVSVANLTILQSLLVSGNFMHGTIPSDLLAMVRLQYVWFNNNTFEGSVPTSFSSLHLLQELFLSNNQFTGTLDGVFNASSQRLLQTILLDGNFLTGSLPTALYALPRLTTLVAVSNCLETTLTEDICNRTSLQTLALDGLQSARNCQQKVTPGLSSYIVGHPIKGQVPSCLFAMPKISTLHLSGNGLEGSLPSDLVVSESLVDLSLSHNSLTGSIPASIQRRQWFNLDLSFNRLTGTLMKDFAADTLDYSQYQQFNGASDPAEEMEVSLENNRLSGEIPASIQSLLNVSVLGSNMFACDVSHSDLPAEDKGSSKYTCGSEGFDAPYYAWLGLLGVVIVAFGCFCWYCTSQVVELWKLIRRWLQAASGGHSTQTSSLVPSVLRMVAAQDSIARLAMIVLLYILVVLLPLYVACSYSYGTYSHKYTWTASAAFLSGEVAAGLEIAFLLLLVVLLVIITHWFMSVLDNNTVVMRRSTGSGTSFRERVTSTASISADLARTSERMGVYALFMFCSFTVVLGVNIAYVYFALYGQSQLLLSIQILLSLFKLFWNNFCAKYLMRWTAHVVSQAAESGMGSHSKELMFVLLLVALVNNIAIPCLVVAVVSPSCYYNVFKQPPTVSASYTYRYCKAINSVDHKCVLMLDGVGDTYYSPPFTYSYQCSSSFVTYYAPAFLFLAITATFLSPASQVLVLLLRKYFPAHPLTSRAANWLIPKILRPIDPSRQVRLSALRPYLDTYRHFSTLLGYMGILVTFGAVFPPLAAAVALTIIATTLFEKISLGYFLTAATEVGAVSLLHAIDTECRKFDGAEVLEQSVWMIGTCACWFYTLFLFDTLGDVQGNTASYWVLIVMPLMPAVLYVLWRFITYGSCMHKSDTSVKPESEKRSLHITEIREAEGVDLEMVVVTHSPLVQE